MLGARGGSIYARCREIGQSALRLVREIQLLEQISSVRYLEFYKPTEFTAEAVVIPVFSAHNRYDVYAISTTTA